MLLFKSWLLNLVGTVHCREICLFRNKSAGEILVTDSYLQFPVVVHWSWNVVMFYENCSLMSHCTLKSKHKKQRSYSSESSYQLCCRRFHVALVNCFLSLPNSSQIIEALSDAILATTWLTNLQFKVYSSHILKLLIVKIVWTNNISKLIKTQTAMILMFSP